MSKSTSLSQVRQCCNKLCAIAVGPRIDTIWIAGVS
jgi:hypothetical protein